MLSENTDFELIPGDDDAWAVRILKGEFIETCIAFGEIKVDGTDKDPLMSFLTSLFDLRCFDDFCFSMYSLINFLFASIVVVGGIWF